jgi:hypothetical protein
VHSFSLVVTPRHAVLALLSPVLPLAVCALAHCARVMCQQEFVFVHSCLDSGAVLADSRRCS